MVNWSKHDNSEDDHEDQGEDCEAGIDLEHVEEEDGELEQVADEVRNLPGYDFHNYHWVHGTLHKQHMVTKIYIKNNYKVLECLRLFWSQRRPFLGIECGGKERLASLKGFNVELNVLLPNLTSLPSFMMVCMKMLPEWRREEQSFARRRLEKNF